MKQKTWGSRKKLALGILLALSMGALGQVDAKEYTTPITGVTADDTEYADISEDRTTSNNYYTFTEDSTIKNDGSQTVELKSSLSGQTFKVATAVTNASTTDGSNTYVVSDGHKLTIDVTAKDDTIGAGVLGTSATRVLNLTPGPEVEINVKGAEGNTQKSYGIWRAATDMTSKYLNVLNEAENPHISINIENENGGYGIAFSRPEKLTLTASQKKRFSNSSLLCLGSVYNPVDLDVKVSENKNATNVLEESAGLYVDTNSGTTRIFGEVDFDVEGHGIFLSGVEGSRRSGSTVVVTNGGKITVHPDEDGAERYAIYNAKGTVEYAAGTYGSVVRDATQIDGDLYLAKGTTTQLGLYGSNAYLNGAVKEDVVDEDGDDDDDDYYYDESETPPAMKLMLADGATWNNVATNAANLGFDTKVTLMSGVNGLLHQTKDSGKVSIDRLDSKLFNIAYDHDATDPTKILGGDVTITTATSGSSVNVFTDYDDHMSTEAKQKEVLDALAQKLWYTNYSTGETNLTGKVSIAEGLTTASASKYYATMSFDEKTGQGYVATDTEVQTPKEAEKQTQTEFTNYVDANPTAVTPYVEAGVYKNGVFTFTEDTKLTFDDSVPTVVGGSWLTSSIKTGVFCGQDMPPTIIDLGGHDLDLSINANSIQTGISSVGTNAVVEINNPGAMSISATTDKSGMTAVLFANWGGQILIHNGGENQEQKILKLRGSTHYSTSGAVVKTMNEKSGLHSYIKIDGLVDIEADTTDGVGMAEGLSAVASTIDVGGGRIIMTASGKNPGVNYGGGAANNAIRAYGEFVSTNTGIVNVNIIKDEDTPTGNAIAAGNNPVQISGDFSTVGGMGTKGKISVGLNTEDSYWVGNYNYGAGWGVTPGDYGVLRLFMGNKAKWLGYSKYATILVMDSGAEWQGYSENNAVDAAIKNGAIWHHYNDNDELTATTLKSLTGGTSAASAGYVDMTSEKSDKDVEVGSYAGYTNILYAHDAENPETITGGNFIIDTAEEGSAVNLLTDNTGFDVHDTDKTISVLDSLTKKFCYKGAINGAENNLTGYVGIADGLTTASAILKIGDMEFSTEDGLGSYVPGSLHAGSADIVYGNSETAMMKGAKTAMAGAALLWRSENNDLMKRMGDLRMGDGKSGAWAKYYGGKNSFNEQNTDLSMKYNAFQAGFDREAGKDWKVGIAISHNTGDASLGNGSADLKATSLGIYGTRLREDGTYLDIIAKATKLDNEYDVYNLYGHKLHGDYDTWGTSLSVEYGKRFDYANGVVVDPSIELTYGRVNSVNYDAKSDYKMSDGASKALHVDQDGFRSFIGRLGVRVGKKTDSASYFAKLALAHEFCGDFDTTFAADGEPTGKTHLDFGGTWLEAQLGVTARMSRTGQFYATLEKTFGGKMDEKWRVDAGMRFSF